ncbi:hypothetical protein TsFJ059_006259 [Trichoderma semiorbis]|uniref:Uncharacterized protein n=1 Tax=Trichoderma semiorbis TaxID=1491008 RepID=A0A9P8KQE6_9HYPO|nr:hypothetical protein TsFJ059_006259 [Trichoderma semiorbis]
MLRPVRSIATCTTDAPTKLAACAGLVPWRDEQARTESSKTFGLSSPAACVGGLPGVTVKHPRVYSKIARRPNGSLRSRLCRCPSRHLDEDSYLLPRVCITPFEGGCCYHDRHQCYMLPGKALDTDLSMLQAMSGTWAGHMFSWTRPGL